MEPSEADDHVQVAVAWSLHYLACIRMVQVTFWTYDYICLLDEEWTYLLQSCWTRVKALYIIARYGPIFSLILTLYLSFAPNEDLNKCRTLIEVYSCFGMISLACSEWIFALRTCALWNNNRIVLVTILATLFVVAATSTGLRFTAISSSYVMTSAIPGITGCYTGSGDIWYFVSLVPLLVFQLGLVSLSLIHAVQNCRTDKGNLYVIMVKHNIFYYACGVFLSATNILVPMLFSDASHRSFEDLEVSILAILATRMHLHFWHSDQRMRSSGLPIMLPSTYMLVGLESEAAEASILRL
ncbi:uncharacterized protein EDB93DRAFT_698475 [Suillus bovinus]|uniref:uncharacterized protein n=1 Tax=Suillus bovinus TaxID=48563 RepID=UPI001B878EAB|nr:uncharacterized protein EDB93DRAFT_698475 [Suillus bovinus]KAG2139596.1 hypothetical protein EDB93DRAFT_698475 [Suillus bovinus]